MARNALKGLEGLLQRIVEGIRELNKEIKKLQKSSLTGSTRAKPGPKPKARKKVKARGPGRKPRKAKICSVRGCGRKHYAKGLCVNHYQAARSGVKKAKATSQRIVRLGRPRVAPKVCSIAGCEQKVVARGLCMNHYQQMRRKAKGKKGK
jgi:hypothetical protein